MHPKLEDTRLFTRIHLAYDVSETNKGFVLVVHHEEQDMLLRIPFAIKKLDSAGY
jgi:hypothetical protein